MPVNLNVKPMYRSWCAMRRNTSPNASPRIRRLYKGISVCTEWMDYDVFQEWSLANGWQKGLYLTRRDKKGDFCPENCFWASLEEANNWRSVVHRLPDGRTVRDIIGRETRGADKTLHNRVSNRIFTEHWDVTSSISKPPRIISPKGESRKTGDEAPVYNTWRNIRKSGICCKEWNDYNVFRQWCLSNGWTKGMFIVRKNTAKPFSPFNCFVLSKCRATCRNLGWEAYLRACGHQP